MEQVRRKFTKEFKEEAVNLVTKGGRRLCDVALSLGIHDSTLVRWVKAHQTQGSDAFRGHGKRTAQEQEDWKLRRKIRELELEVEFLKKVSRYFAKDPSKDTGR